MIHWLFDSISRAGGVSGASVCEDDEGFRVGAGHCGGGIRRHWMRNRPREQSALPGHAPLRCDDYREARPGLRGEWRRHPPCSRIANCCGLRRQTALCLILRAAEPRGRTRCRRSTGPAGQGSLRQAIAPASLARTYLYPLSCPAERGLRPSSSRVCLTFSASAISGQSSFIEASQTSG